MDRLCDLVVRVPGYISRDPGFDSRRYEIFWELVCLERGPLNLVDKPTSGGGSVGIVRLRTKRTVLVTFPIPIFRGFSSRIFIY
jgi:hypothetical protein